ncbi:hypothetical protein [Herbaspirillum sp. C7C8]|uniref:hypothetical protein n=1 Tax=Herbaspirillum sp. C7C8 TaxID=2736665 RepID=UPI001F523905|nr:hypothetical protein [Herbaspirillum sp. C7C8]MCI1006493.1 hypothetical protein [Herbaspirillum sp. C7C8]
MRVFLKTLWAFLKQGAGPKTWLFSLAKENLGPKIGAGIAVYKLGDIILTGMVEASKSPSASSLSAADITTRQAAKFFDLLAPMDSTWYLYVAISCMVIWVAALFVRSTFRFKKIRSVWFFKFGQYGYFFNIGAQFFMGLLLVPMVLAGAVVILVPDAFDQATTIHFGILAVGYVIVIIAMHHLAFIERELPNSINYNIEASSMVEQKIPQKVVRVFEDKLTELTWVGAPDACAVSKDRRLMINIPVLYDAANWSKDESSELGSKLHQAEKDLAEMGCTVLSRVIPEGIQRRLPPNLKKLYQDETPKSMRPSS